MSRPVVTFTREGHAELDAFLAERIYEFNAKSTGFHNGELFAAAVRNPDDDIIAAVTGHTWGGTCHVTHLWVHESRRRNGLGKSLMGAVEAEARRRGCRQIILATHSFQAPTFYERLGFRRQASIADYPAGHEQLHYRKCLADANDV